MVAPLKQTVVPCSFVEAEYNTMTSNTTETEILVPQLCIEAKILCSLGLAFRV